MEIILYCFDKQNGLNLKIQSVLLERRDKMDRKDELDTFIKELSDKQQQYQQKIEYIPENTNIELPELVPIDFDLSVDIDQKTTEQQQPYITDTDEEENFLKSLWGKITQLGLTKKLNPLIDKVKQIIKQKPGISMLIVGTLITTLGFGVFAGKVQNG